LLKGEGISHDGRWYQTDYYLYKESRQRVHDFGNLIVIFEPGEMSGNLFVVYRLKGVAFLVIWDGFF